MFDFISEYKNYFCDKMIWDCLLSFNPQQDI